VRLRRRLVATMIVLVALGLAAVDIITLTSLHSYLFGRVDAQLDAASAQVAEFVARADERGFVVTAASVQSRVSPDVYVELINPTGRVVVAKPSGSHTQPDPRPNLPNPLPVRPTPDLDHPAKPDQVYRPDSTSITVGMAGPGRQEYRLHATALPGETLVVATRLDSVNATLNSLRNIELAVSLGLLVALLVLMTLLVRLGLRPLEDMTEAADAIAAGDLTRRVQVADSNSEIARLGRALNGMLAQIETAFAERARSQDRLRSFLADASHELRTPLTSIRGYAELLRKDALGDRAARDRALSRIEKEAARMGVLVGDLAILAREDEGPAPGRYRVDLAAVASDAVADARTIDADRPIELSVSTEVPVAGDDARLEQMIHNLLRNALAHTPPGTPVEVSVAVEGDHAVLQVRDGGPGMSAEQAGQVFDRFYRGDAEGREGGSGLGLFIVASLARTFGGHATVVTAVGEGATFEVVLPLYDPPATPATPAMSATPMTPSTSTASTPGLSPPPMGAGPPGPAAGPPGPTGRTADGVPPPDPSGAADPVSTQS
jgi:two-component system OmpR family sensor kinase